MIKPPEVEVSVLGSAVVLPQQAVLQLSSLPYKKRVGRTFDLETVTQGVVDVRGEGAVGGEQNAGREGVEGWGVWWSEDMLAPCHGPSTLSLST